MTCKLIALLDIAVIAASAGFVLALGGDAAAGVAFLALATAITCTVVRLLLRKDAR